MNSKLTYFKYYLNNDKSVPEERKSRLSQLKKSRNQYTEFLKITKHFYKIFEVNFIL